MDAFETALAEAMPALERFVRFRIGNPYDAEDVIQDTCAAALQKRETLRAAAAFKGWLLQIARNKCTDHYRKQAAQLELPIDELNESVLQTGLYGRTEATAVSETLERLGGKEQQILYLYYFKELPQDQIAARLGVPLGTVKSRLFHAKRKFRETYPSAPQSKERGTVMKKLPETLPEYTIVDAGLPPFTVRWEELLGWFIVPKPGETCAWAIYDQPSRARAEHYELEAVGRAEIHGIEGVELAVREYEGGSAPVERRCVAQLTQTHCRMLAESWRENGMLHCRTFLDGDEFLGVWGFGADNCGKEVQLTAKGDIVRDGARITAADKPFVLDVVGRYTVTINGKTFDTVCVMDCSADNDGMMTEQFIDQKGRTVLWRRWNRDDWALERYQKTWSEQLPDNERLTVNGKTYVHWYDCISDYIL